jgi:hypothetical protein
MSRCEGHNIDLALGRRIEDFLCYSVGYADTERLCTLFRDRECVFLSHKLTLAVGFQYIVDS